MLKNWKTTKTNTNKCLKNSTMLKFRKKKNNTKKYNNPMINWGNYLEGKVMTMSRMK